jgi:hypothetical protein
MHVDHPASLATHGSQEKLVVKSRTSTPPQGTTTPPRTLTPPRAVTPPRTATTAVPRTAIPAASVAVVNAPLSQTSAAPQAPAVLRLRLECSGRQKNVEVGAF